MKKKIFFLKWEGNLIRSLKVAEVLSHGLSCSSWKIKENDVALI